MAKRTRKTKLEAPQCNCIMLCDDVLMSAGRGKHNLMGVIGVVVIGQLPGILGGYVAYIRLSHVYGTQDIEVSFGKVDGAPLFAFRARVGNAEGPLGVHTIVVPIPPFRVEESGRYSLAAKAPDGKLIAASPVEIVCPAESGEGTS